MDQAKLATVIILIVIFIAAVLGNGLVLVVRLWTTKRRRITVYEILICHLAVVDLLYSLNIPIFIELLLKGRWDFGSPSCKFLRTLESVTLYVSILNVVIIAFERFRSISRPLSYRWSSCKTAVILFCAWLWSFVSFIPLTVSLHVRTFCEPKYQSKRFQQVFTMAQFLIAYILPLVIISALNLKIVLALRHRARTARLGNTTGGMAMNTSSSMPSFQCTQQDSQYFRSNTMSESNGTRNALAAHSSLTRQYKTVTKVLLAFTITFMLFCLQNHIFHLRSVFGSDKKTSTTTLDIVFNIIGYMIFLNSCINPFIYSMVDQRFRRDVRNFFFNVLR